MTTAERRSPGWDFRSKWRRSAFGWRGSRLAITRLHEALSEIRAVARRDEALAAEGAVLLLEKVSPALQDVDSSSGALGSAVYSAVDELVPLIAAARVDDATRDRWLERLFEAIQEDDPPYIESLGDAWGELCVTAERASRWVDELMPLVRHVLADRKTGGFGWFSGTSLCYSALFKANRHDELLALLDEDPAAIWLFRVWGGRVYAVRGEVDHAIAYMQQDSAQHPMVFAQFAEEVLLGAGRRVEAYEQYAIAAHKENTYLATYRAIAKRYPEVDPDRLLEDLIASTPGCEGKWFATARTLKRFDVALALARKSSTEPKTLLRAAAAEVEAHPSFACEAALLALHWISFGYGYDISGADIAEADRLARQTAMALGRSDEVGAQIDALAKRSSVDFSRWTQARAV